MKKLLHIIATPRTKDSRTLKVAAAALEAFKKQFPDAEVDELNLFEEALPEMGVTRVGGKYALMAGGELAADVKKTWTDIEAHIQRFLAADIYLVSTPMWNFGIPYRLKHYIDVIVQPKYLFRYTSAGPEGLVKNKRMIVLSSRGGDYSAGTPAEAFDQMTPYLRTVFGFVGIMDMTYIYAQPQDAGPEDLRNGRLQEAIRAARALTF